LFIKFAFQIALFSNHKTSCTLEQIASFSSRFWACLTTCLALYDDHFHLLRSGQVVNREKPLIGALLPVFLSSAICFCCSPQTSKKLPHGALPHNISYLIQQEQFGVAVKKAKELLIKNIEENGIHLTELLTPAVDAKLDELIHTIIEEHGYAKLASVGLKAHSRD
jgi:hypothetical protein